MAGRKSLVTGGTGFIGSHLVEALLNQGEEVRCLVRKESSNEWIKGLDVEICQGDCTELPSLRAAVEGVEVVYQLAGVSKATDQRAFYRTNVLGTENLIRACIERNPNLKRFVYLSSQAAAGPCKGKGLSIETDPCRPVSDYGRSKREGEQAVARVRDRLNTVILRACAVYGPRDRDFLPFFRSIGRGIDFGLLGMDHRLSLCYVSDLVSVIMMAGKRDLSSGEVFFVSDGNVYRWQDLGIAVAEAMGVRTMRLRLPVPVLRWSAYLADWISRRSGRPPLLGRDRCEDMIQPNWCCDITKVVSKLGFSPSFDLRRGVASTVAWYRSRGWLRS